MSLKVKNMRYRNLRFPGGKLKALTFSYDDGVKQDIKLSETLCRYGLKGSFNLNSAYIGHENRLSVEDISEHIIAKGHEITVHGEHHKAPGCVTAIEGIKDVLNCRLCLEKEFGIMVRGMAYPDSGIRHMENGANYQTIKNYLTDLGIVYARTLAGDNDIFRLPDDWHAWMPSAHHNNPKIFEMIDKFVSIKEDWYGPNRYPRLMYIWGHSYEFDNDKNWDRLEEICQKLANKEDIWYATNIEIYDYVTAYNSLIFSADGQTVYNPTLQEIWFEADSKTYVIASGETIKI